MQLCENMCVCVCAYHVHACVHVCNVVLLLFACFFPYFCTSTTQCLVAMWRIFIQQIIASHKVAASMSD